MGIKVLAVGAAAAVLLAPGAAVLGVATLISPAAAGSGSCMWDGQATESLGVSGPVPDSLSATNTNGETVTLNQQQLTRAATIIATGESENIPARGQMIAIMTALTESSLRVLSNTGAYPDSGNIPNDGDGSDHDSVGLFQQRPAAGWGSVENLMDPVWSSRAFYGGPSGPNHGSPRGLLDIDGWASMDPGAAAQAVQVSAYPDRYAVNQPIAEKVLATLSGVSLSSELACAQPAGDVPLEPPARVRRRLHQGRRIATRQAVRLGRRQLQRTHRRRLRLLRPRPVRRLPSLRRTHPTPPLLRRPDPRRPRHPLRQKEPGDLIFFSYPGAGGPHHVAIYVGGDRILAGEVMTVRRLAGPLATA